MNSTKKTTRNCGKRQSRLLLIVCLLLPFLSGCGDAFSPSSTSNSDSTADQSDNSINGVQDCETTCEPVDVSNCNDAQTIDTASPTCFLVSQHCSIPTGNNGPELVPIAPVDCVFGNDLLANSEEPIAE